MALLGEHLALMNLTPDQLRALPIFDPAGTAPVPPAWAWQGRSIDALGPFGDRPGLAHTRSLDCKGCAG